MTLRNRLFADGLYTFGVRIINMICAAGLGILTARVLGPHGRGIYAMPMVDAGLVTAAFAGLSSGTAYFLLRKEAGRGVLRPVFLCAAAFILAGAVATYIIAFAAHATWAAIPAMLSLPAPAALMIGSGYATGTHRIRITTTLAVCSTLTAIVFMAGAFLLLGRAPSSAIIAWVASGNAIGAAILFWVIRDARKLPAGTVSFGEYAHYTIRAGAVNLVSLLNYRADIYIVALLTSPVLLGMYTVAVTAAETLLTATQVTAVVASPHVGSMEQRAAAELTARCVRHNVLVAGICSGLLAIVAPYAVQLLYGPAFLPMVPALRVLLIGVFALSLGSPMSTYFSLRMGRPEIALVLASASAVVCIVTSWILVPRIGLVGAAIGSTLAYVLGQATAIIYFSITAGISARTMLLPRWSDVMTYVTVAGSFIARRRGTIDSPG